MWKIVIRDLMAWYRRRGKKSRMCRMTVTNWIASWYRRRGKKSRMCTMIIRTDDGFSCMMVLEGSRAGTVIRPWLVMQRSILVVIKEGAGGGKT